jgi:hypothetical protein
LAIIFITNRDENLLFFDLSVILKTLLKLYIEHDNLLYYNNSTMTYGGQYIETSPIVPHTVRTVGKKQTRPQKVGHHREVPKKAAKLV